MLCSYEASPRRKDQNKLVFLSNTRSLFSFLKGKRTPFQILPIWLTLVLAKLVFDLYPFLESLYYMGYQDEI